VTLLSVNVGTPHAYDWRGRTLHTAIRKVPVDGRVAVRGVNVAGDDQADREAHGGPDQALYAYASEDYAWWESEVGAPIEYGRFGENLTTSGVDVSGALIGERWRIGTTLLEVRLPRIPCSKLAMRMDDPQFVRRFAQASRPGAYLGILEEGEIGAGDAIAVAFRPHTSVSIAESAAIYYAGKQRAAELLAVERLPQSWRDWVAKALSAPA
jgi:MOSC domain-containing protein YiiM